MQQQQEEAAIQCIQRLKHLQTLYDNSFITKDDFDTRKSQIVDELTGTNSTQSRKTTTRKQSTLQGSFVGGSIDDPMNIVLAENQLPKKKKTKRKKIEVIKHCPPDWEKIREEKAEKWIYIYGEDKWVKEQCKVKIDEIPFDKGGLRYVFHLMDLSEPNKQYVAKMSQDMRDNIKKQIYFNDVRMQRIAKHFTASYNSYDPPKKVDFLDAYVLHLKQREGSPVCHVEEYIAGSYKKYNNNVGWVSEEERNTPQAFGHFTYEASKKKLLVCDIQGVGDVYTDPQVHSSENVKAFGRGNLGTKGFENFLRTHRCNPICQYLKLKNINQLPIINMGTLPANTQIPNQISTVPYNFNKTAPLLSDRGFPKIIESKEENNDDEASTCCSHCLIL